MTRTLEVVRTQEVTRTASIPPPPPAALLAKQAAKLRAKLGLTIGTKLVSLLALLLMSSVVGIVILATRMFIEDNTALIQQINADTASGLATQTRELLQNISEKTRVIGRVILQNRDRPDVKAAVVGEFFSQDKDFLAVFLHQGSSGGIQLIDRAVSPQLAEQGDAGGDQALEALATDRDFSLQSALQGEAQIGSFTTAEGSSAIALGLPFDGQVVLTALVRQGRLAKAFSETELVTSFLVDRQGRMLAHSDSSQWMGAEDVSQLAIVRELLEAKVSNKQTRYTDERTKTIKLGAFRTLSFAGLGVIAEVAEGKAFQAARKVQYRAMLLAVIILCLSFWIGYWYSGTLTWPITQLMEATRRIQSGDFKINLKPKGHDELAHLSSTFNEMAKGLEERDRVKETFNKFHNKEIAEKLLSGEVKLGGERKVATIFFSDVRGFTAMSESMEPEQVVEMLNEYMTRMVAVIRAHGGVVDKYVGDAIMALWGVPLSHDDDCVQAVRACLGMRKELEELNTIRISRGQNVIKIGMGLNVGPLIAGNIGSNEKMEYTVIGDTVNLASRIESMTKEYGTDLLISSDIRARIGDQFILETAGSTHVKGKAEAVEVYKVQGYIDSSGVPVIVQTPYSSYTPEKSDKVVHA